MIIEELFSWNNQVLFLADHEFGTWKRLFALPAEHNIRSAMLRRRDV